MKTVLKAAISKSFQSLLPSYILAKMQGVYTQRNEVAALLGYTGKLFRLALKSNTAIQQDFFTGFTNADVLAFGIATNLVVTTRYDISGKGYDITQSTGSLMPLFTLDPLNNEWVILYDMSWYKGVNAVRAGCYLDNASMPMATTTLFALDICINAHGNASANLVNPVPLAHQFDFSSNLKCSWFGSLARGTAVSPQPATISRLDRYINSGANELLPRSLIALEDTFPTYQYYKNTGANSTIVNRGMIGSGTIVSTTTTGVRQGKNFGTSSTIAYSTFYGTGLTDGEISTLLDLLCPIYSIPRLDPQRQIIINGDSISAGYNYAFEDEPHNYSWMRFAAINESRIRNNCLIRNKAIAGGHLNSTASGATQYKEMLPVVADRIGTLYNTTQFPLGQLVIVFIGTNDLASNRTAIAVEADLNSYCTAIRAMGYKVIVLDCIPRQSFTAPQEVERLAYNVLIAANWASYADGFVQISAQNWTPSGSYATYYADGTHPNALGQNYIVDAVKSQILSLLGL